MVARWTLENENILFFYKNVARARTEVIFEKKSHDNHSYVTGRVNEK